MDSINIYYQSASHGKEIANSLDRYLKYRLGKNVIKTEIDTNTEDIPNNPTDVHYLLFTNLSANITYWGAILGRICKEIDNKEWQLKIIDLTFQKDFPIIADPEIIISCNSCKDWLSKIMIKEAKAIKIKPTKNYLREYNASIDH